MKNLFIDAKKNGQFRTFFNNDSETSRSSTPARSSIALGYPGNAIDREREGDPVEFATAKEGQIVWTCGYGISTQAEEHRRRVRAASNYYLSPEAEAFEAKRWNYYVTNQDALKLLPPDQVKRLENGQGLEQHPARGAADRGLRQVDPRLAGGEEELVAGAVRQDAAAAAAGATARGRFRSPTSRSGIRVAALLRHDRRARLRHRVHPSALRPARAAGRRSRSTTRSSSRCRGAASR